MPKYEYKVVPAPLKGQRAKGVKGAEARFAHALETIMNDYGSDGWEYVRTDTLPSEERSGLTGTKTQYRNMLVFRRSVPGDVAEFQPKLLGAPLDAEEPKTPVFTPDRTDPPLTAANRDVAAE